VIGAGGQPQKQFQQQQMNLNPQQMKKTGKYQDSIGSIH